MDEREKDQEKERERDEREREIVNTHNFIHLCIL